MTTDEERAASFEARQRGEIPALKYAKVRPDITPLEIARLYADGQQVTDADIRMLRERRNPAWLTAVDAEERAALLAPPKPAAAAKPTPPPVVVNTQGPAVLDVGKMIRDTLLLPVKPVHDDMGNLLYAQRIAPPEPDPPPQPEPVVMAAPVPEPEPTPKPSDIRNSKKPATISMLFTMQEVIIKQVAEVLRDHHERLEALEAKPHLKFRGVYMSAQQYAPGDVATFQGSMWHCNQSTVDRPGTSDSWVLCVKKGRDAKDAR